MEDVHVPLYLDTEIAACQPTLSRPVLRTMASERMLCAWRNESVSPRQCGARQRSSELAEPVLHKRQVQAHDAYVSVYTQAGGDACGDGASRSRSATI